MDKKDWQAIVVIALLLAGIVSIYGISVESQRASRDYMLGVNILTSDIGDDLYIDLVTPNGTVVCTFSTYKSSNLGGYYQYYGVATNKTFSYEDSISMTYRWYHNETGDVVEEWCYPNPLSWEDTYKNGNLFVWLDEYGGYTGNGGSALVMGRV